MDDSTARTDQPENHAGHDANAAGERGEVVDASLELRPSLGAPKLADEHPAHKTSGGEGVAFALGAWPWAKGGGGAYQL